jgi:hypothetical protein
MALLHKPTLLLGVMRLSVPVSAVINPAKVTSTRNQSPLGWCSMGGRASAVGDVLASYGSQQFEARGFPLFD